MVSFLAKLFFFRTRSFEMQINKDARIDDLIKIFNQIIDSIKPSTIITENIFNTLFLTKMPITSKLVEVAKILIKYNIEMNLKIIDKTHDAMCEIKSHRDTCQENIIRVLHYFSDNVPAFSKIILV